jgi:hypothetical protein
MNGCKESVKSKSNSSEAETVKVDSIGKDNSNENKRIIQDTVSYVLFSFAGKVNPEWIDDSYNHAKRIDKIHISSITEIDLNDLNFKELIINHKDSKDFILAKITVPKSFNIKSLNDGWVCSIRNREDKIDGPLSIYFSNFVEMYTTTYDNGKDIGINSIYDSAGEIILNGVKLTKNNKK